MKQGWVIKRLDDACEVEYGTRVVQKRDGGTIYSVYGGGGATFFMDTFNREDCLVVARFAMSAQCTRFVQGKFFLNDSGLTVKSKNEQELLQDFLNLQMFFLNDYIYSLSRGTAQRNLDVPAFGNIQIVYPKSIPEQQRIVSILDEAFAAIAKAKANAERCLSLSKALFESYLQGVIDPSTRSGQGKGEGWEETRLNNEIELIVGFAFKSKGYTELEDDILLVRGDNIMQGYFRWDDAKRWSNSEYNNFRKYQLEENDIILAMDRPWVKAGLKIAMISKMELPALLVQRTACLRTKGKLHNSFLFYLLKSNRFMEYLINVQTGIGVPHISGQQILEFKFNKPSILEQQTIVRQLDDLQAETQKLEVLYQKKIEDLEELKKSVLQKAFRGELSEL